MNSASILIIDDEDAIRKLVTITLELNNYKVSEASTGKEGLNSVSDHPPDLVLLDIGLPDQSGHEVLKHLREWYSNPVIIVSVQSSEDDIIKALDNGANDYVVKPFRTGDLLARIRSALRKAEREPNLPTITFENFSIDFMNRTVNVNNSQVKLTPTEYSILSILVRNEGKVVTRKYLLDKVWDESHQNESQYLRVFIGQLRKKIETDPNRPAHIITESGIGYRFIGHTTNA